MNMKTITILIVDMALMDHKFALKWMSYFLKLVYK